MYLRIVGRKKDRNMYVLGDFGAVFVVPFPVHWVWDMDGVEMATFKLIVNEA